MKTILDDELWAVIQPLLPPPKPRRPHHPGRKPVDPRVALTGILYVLITGIPWEYFPPQMGCSGMTCWRYLRDWQASGTWAKIHAVLLARLHRAEKIDWDRVAVDSALLRAVGAGEKNRPQSHRPAQARKQASPGRRRPRHSPFRALVGGAPPRRK